MSNEAQDRDHAGYGYSQHNICCTWCRDEITRLQIQIAELKGQVTHYEKDSTNCRVHFEEELERMTPYETFAPVRLLVYGLASSILLVVVGSLLRLVVK